MVQLAADFTDIEIVSKLSTQLSWSRFIEMLPAKTQEARIAVAEY
jgi:hypothetical protein